MSWEDRLSKVGVEGWRAAVLAKAEHWDEYHAAYQAWAKTPRGRLTLAWRRIKRVPSNIRYALAALIYPGNLNRDLDRSDW